MTINAKINEQTGNLHFQDYVQSSAKLEIGRCVEIPFAGPYTAARFEVIGKETAPCGTKHNFIARRVA